MGGMHLIPHHLVCIWLAAWPRGTQSERAHSSSEVSQQDQSQERILINNGQVVEATASRAPEQDGERAFSSSVLQTYQLATASLSEDRGQSFVQR